MANSPDRGQIGIRLSTVLDILGEKMYSSDVVFIRENVQNAIDAVRIRKARDGMGLNEMRIEVRISPDRIEIEDWGIGMTPEDIKQYFWNVGHSSKNTEEARNAGCIGQFGIGGFANFGRCSEVHVYTAKNNKSAVYSYVKKDDLKNDKGDYLIQATNVINHQGTLIRCFPLVDSAGNKGKFEVSKIRDYLTNYIEFVSEKILINENKSSQQVFVKEATKNNLTEKSTKTAKMLIRALVFTDSNGKSKLVPVEVEYGSKKYELKGELEWGASPISIYKHGFFLDNFKDYWNHFLSGKLDIPFVQPLANREDFDYSSRVLIKELHDGFANILADYVAGNSGLINDVSNVSFMEYVNKTEKFHLINKLEVALADGTRLPLEQLKKNLSTYSGGKVYYGKSGSENQASAFQAARNTVVLIGGLGYKSQDNAEKYLVNFCKGEFIPEVFVDKIYEKTSLNENTQYLIEIIRKHLKAKGCSQLSVIPCELNPLESMPFLLEEKNLQLYFNVSHSLIIKIISFADKIDLDVVIDNLILDFIGSAIPRIRAKMFDARGLGLSYFTDADDIQYEVMIERIDEVFFVSGGGGKWYPSNEKLLCIESNDFPEMAGYYLKLPEPVCNIYGKRLDAEVSIEVIWILWEINYLIYHDADELLKIVIKLEKDVQDQNTAYLAGHSGLGKHIRGYSISENSSEKAYFIPVPEEIKENLVPGSIAKKIYISPKLVTRKDRS